MSIRTSLPGITFCLEQAWNAIVSSPASDRAHGKGKELEVLDAEIKAIGR